MLPSRCYQKSVSKQSESWKHDAQIINTVTSCPIMSGHSPSGHVMPYLASSCSIMSHHASSCSILSCHVPSCFIMLRHAPPCFIMPHLASSCSIMSHHASSCSIMPHTYFIVLHHAPSRSTNWLLSLWLSSNRAGGHRPPCSSPSSSVNRSCQCLSQQSLSVHDDSSERSSLRVSRSNKE